MIQRLRRAVLVAWAAVVGSLTALWLTFGVLVDPGAPGPGESCRTGLYGGPYTDALVPAHLAALAVLAAAIWQLESARAVPPTPSRRTVIALALLGTYALAAALGPDVLAWPLIAAFFGVTPVAGVYGIVALVRTIKTNRSSLPDAERWRRHGAIASWGAWIAATFGLGATFVGSYVNGAGLFCF